MKLESKTVETSKSPEELYAFLCNVENYERIMPENISKFEVRDEDSFVFALKGMPEIRLRLTERIPFTLVSLGSASDKFDFSLSSSIGEIPTGSKVALNFQGDFNPMMAMMVKKPLKNFIEHLADSLSRL